MYVRGGKYHPKMAKNFSKHCERKFAFPGQRFASTPFIWEKSIKNFLFEYPSIDYSMLVQFFVFKFCSIGGLNLHTPRTP